MRPHSLIALLLASVSLSGCAQTWKPPEISYDDTPRPAVLERDPPKAIRIVEIPSAAAAGATEAAPGRQNGTA